MKKKILGVVFIFAIAILATLNINLTKADDSNSNLPLLNIQTAFAEGEYAGWDNFWQGQGFYKDERELARDCPIMETTTEGISVPMEGGTVTIGSSHTQVNPPTRQEIICPSGDKNCSVVRC